MSVINANPLLAAAGGDYTISRSVRIRSSATAYFNRTPASATNRQIMTFSMWVKLGSIVGSSGYLISANTASGYNDGFGISFSSGTLDLSATSGGSTVCDLNTTQVFRDPSAWYHVVYAIDTTQATSSNRIKLYINGIQVTSFSTATYPSQNASLQMNNTVATYIGRLGYTSSVMLDGYLTEVNFIDGQAMTPSSFGETDVLTGVWKPKKYAGTYGTNGFYLNFSDNSNNTAATIGKDSSGNGNNWTPNNISVTSGVTYDSMLDVPTMWADGGNGRGNYATLNPLMLNSATLSEANLKHTGTYGSGSTVAMKSKKWYCEFTCTAIGAASAWVGISDNIQGAGSSYPSNIAIYGNEFGDKYVNGSSASYGATWTTNDVIGCAYDADNNTITFYKNGTSQGTISSLTASTNGYYFFINGRSSTLVMAVNFGQRPFAYTPPTGFKALNTQNLPEGTIKKGSSYFNTVLYTGNSSTQSITGVGFQPDLLWIKGRSASGYDNVLQDVVRGSTYQLYSNTTDAEVNDVDAVTAFNTDGFALGADVTVNNSGVTFVGWNWKAGGTAVSNTSGSITSTVSVNASAGFSVVSFTLNNANFTVGHGLGVAPKMIILANRDAANNRDVYHASIGATQRLILSGTDAASASPGWNNTAPTSTVFSGQSSWWTNPSTARMIAYCWSEVAGFSKFGSYTGNGSADGPFVYCGFRPRYVLRKRTDAAWRWFAVDSSRDGNNVANSGLFPNYSNAEEVSTTNWGVDFLSNGFKVRSTDVESNASGGTYIYAAFAENPFKNSLAR